MALNIKNAEVERLAAEVAMMAGESKTEAIRNALLERAERLAQTHNRGQRMKKWLEENVWPKLAPEVRGKGISKAEREAILGIGPNGVCE